MAYIIYLMNTPQIMILTLNAFKEARELLNERGSNLSNKERNEIRKKTF